MRNYPEWFDFKSEGAIDIDEIIINDKIRHRFRIEYNLNKDYKNCLIVIMMNPSKANKEESDQTINDVLNYSKDRYDRVIILNSLSIYESESNRLNTYTIEYDFLKKNVEKIKECLKSNEGSPVVLNTGTPKNRAGAESLTYIYDCLRNKHETFSFPKVNLEEENQTKEGYTRHISRSGKIDNERDLVSLNLDVYSSI